PTKPGVPEQHKECCDVSSFSLSITVETKCRSYVFFRMKCFSVSCCNSLGNKPDIVTAPA
ncbi:9393_t:CDS:2, partial [Funneliformis mosseae]